VAGTTDPRTRRYAETSITNEVTSAVGIYQEQGLLDGRWVDTIIMEKLL
jgi:hypothetical protein